MKAGLATLRRANRQWPMVLAILMAWALVAKTRPAHAHALLTRSDPVPGVVLPVNLPATRISLWFTEPVEVAFNAIAVLTGA